MHITSHFSGPYTATARARVLNTSHTARAVTHCARARRHSNTQRCLCKYRQRTHSIHDSGIAATAVSNLCGQLMYTFLHSRARIGSFLYYKHILSFVSFKQLYIFYKSFLQITIHNYTFTIGFIQHLNKLYDFIEQI